MRKVKAICVECRHYREREGVYVAGFRVVIPRLHYDWCHLPRRGHIDPVSGERVATESVKACHERNDKGKCRHFAPDYEDCALGTIREDWGVGD